MSSIYRLIAVRLPFRLINQSFNFFLGKRPNYRAIQEDAADESDESSESEPPDCSQEMDFQENESSESEEETVSNSEQSDKQEGVQFDRPAAGCDLPDFYIHISDESD